MQTIVKRAYVGRGMESWDYPKDGKRIKGERHYAYFTDLDTLECVEVEVRADELVERLARLGFGEVLEVTLQAAARGQQVVYVLRQLS